MVRLAQTLCNCGVCSSPVLATAIDEHLSPRTAPGRLTRLVGRVRTGPHGSLPVVNEDAVPSRGRACTWVKQMVRYRRPCPSSRTPTSWSSLMTLALGCDHGRFPLKARGMRRKAAEGEGAEQAGAASRNDTPEPPAPSRCGQTWAMLIKRVYEIDPLASPRCGGQMKVVAFFEPPQGAVIETFPPVYP